MIETQTLLGLLEQTEQICTFDIETTGREADYDSMIVASVKPVGRKPEVFKVKKIGYDKTAVGELKSCLSGYLCWITYYGKGFDVPFVNTRLLYWNLPPLPPTMHLDMYYTLRGKLLTGRKSQGHLASWLELPTGKMSVSASTWSKAPAEPSISIPKLTSRCVSDAAGLEQLYHRTKHLVRELKG